MSVNHECKACDVTHCVHTQGPTKTLLANTGSTIIQEKLDMLSNIADSDDHDKNEQDSITLPEEREEEC